MDAVTIFTVATQIALFLVILTLIYRRSPWTLFLHLLDNVGRNLGGAPVARLSRITPQLYVGGQHTPRGWAAMQRLGITAIVNLREAQHDDAARGIAPSRYLHLPTRDNTPPTPEQLQAGSNFIREEIASGGVVYIHCASGIGRAPTLAAAYLISTGLTPRAALALLRRRRPFIQPTRSQRAALLAFAERGAP